MKESDNSPPDSSVERKQYQLFFLHIFGNGDQYLFSLFCFYRIYSLASHILPPKPLKNFHCFLKRSVLDKRKLLISENYKFFPHCCSRTIGRSFTYKRRLLADRIKINNLCLEKYIKICRIDLTRN